MKIFYHCYAGAHSSVVASAMHCGLLPQDRVPSVEEIEAVPYYDRTEPSTIGTPHFMGNDEHGNEVYCIGMRRGSDIVKRAIVSFLQINGLATDEIRFYEALHVINMSTKLGGGLSRKFGYVTVGRRLSSWGIQRCYPGFIELVSTVKKELAEKT